MSSHIVDKLVMEVGLEAKKFKAQAKAAESDAKRVEKSVKNVGEAGKKSSGETGKLGDSIEKTGKQTAQANKSLLAAAKALKGIFVAVTGSVALEKLGNSIAKANDQLYFMQQRLNLNSRAIKTFSNAAAALGGDAGAMTATMQGLNQSIQSLVMTGDASILPFFNALGVGVTDAYGQVRAMDDILLDMADSFHGMKPEEGYALASMMGIDDATANALMQGKSAMLEMLGLQKNLHTSTQQELAASRELRKAQAILGAHWDGLKTMLGNAIIPLLTKLTEGAQTFVNFLMRHERSVKNVMEGLAYVIGGVLVVALGKATVAALALMAPFAPLIAVVTALGAAFLLLYDDYKVWANGGESLFNWGKFIGYIESANFSLDNLTKAFWTTLTGYESLDAAIAGFNNWLKLKGFIDETGFSFKSLGTGIKNVVKDILDAIPILKVFADMANKLMTGDFVGAAKLSLELPKATTQTLVGGVSWGAEKLAGLVDIATGHDPEEEGTLSSGARGFGGWLTGLSNKWLGKEQGDFGKLGQIGAQLMPTGMPIEGGATNFSSSLTDARDFSRGGGLVTSSTASHSANTQNDVSVNVGGIVVNTSASDLPKITNEALAQSIKSASNPLSQIAGGL